MVSCNNVECWPADHSLRVETTSVEHFSCILGSIEEKPEEFKFDVHHTLTVCFVNLRYFDKNRNARCL